MKEKEGRGVVMMMIMIMGSFYLEAHCFFDGPSKDMTMSERERERESVREYFKVICQMRLRYYMKKNKVVWLCMWAIERRK